MFFIYFLIYLILPNFFASIFNEDLGILLCPRLLLEDCMFFTKVLVLLPVLGQPCKGIPRLAPYPVTSFCKSDEDVSRQV